MAVFELQEQVSTGAVPPQVSLRVASTDLVQALRGEFDSYYVQMRSFQNQEIGDVLLALSAMTARASELRAQLSRSDTRAFNFLRTREVEPFLEECDRQFKVFSRLQAIRSMDWEISRGFS